MGTRRFTIFAGGLAAFALAASAGAQELPGDPAMGRNLAQKVCQQCHHVEPGDSEGRLPKPPAFQNLADDPAMTPLALRAFLTSPHTNMPNLILTDAEVDDVIAYIHSMKSD
jgi:mono/diheme cytochrome c family protein